LREVAAVCDPNTSLPGDFSADFDDALLAQLQAPPRSEDYDLGGGLTGFGLYALEHPLPEVRAALVRGVLRRLDAQARHTSHGVTWFTAPDRLYGHELEDFPHGFHNLGLAHGVPGVIALLGAACGAGVAADIARPLLDGAVAWLMEQRLPAGSPSHFGYWAGPDIKTEPARLAWCYGDLGLAAALLGAARCTGDMGWERAALEIARRAAARPPQESRVVDAGLCHGSAGAGHIFNRLYQASGEEAFAAAARFWFAHTLRLRQPQGGLAGFLSLEPVGDGRTDWRAEPGLLTGAAGVGLALLAATTATEPAWDRSLLVAIPPIGVFS
jgi:hypothetical protein